MLRLIPDTPVDVIERCSGHGGTFGVVKPTHDVAVKVGRPVFRAANTQKRGHIVSDCPLAAQHIVTHTEHRRARAGTSHSDHGARLWIGSVRCQPSPAKLRQPISFPIANMRKSARNCAPKRSALKKHRRVEVGPFATFYFENYAHHVAAGAWRCCASRKAATNRSPGELDAYNPLIPQGDELIATLMLEIEDANRRNAMLLALGGIEETRVHGNRRRPHRTPRLPNMTTAPRPTERPHPCIGCASNSPRTRSRASRPNVW